VSVFENPYEKQRYWPGSQMILTRTYAKDDTILASCVPSYLLRRYFWYRWMRSLAYKSSSLLSASSNISRTIKRISYGISWTIVRCSNNSKKDISVSVKQQKHEHCFEVSVTDVFNWSAYNFMISSFSSPHVVPYEAVLLLVENFWITLIAFWFHSFEHSFLLYEIFSMTQFTSFASGLMIKYSFCSSFGSVN